MDLLATGETKAEEKAEAFKREMAEIFAKYNVTMTVREATAGYESYAEGVDFDIESFDESEDGPYCTFVTVEMGCYIDSNDFTASTMCYIKSSGFC